MIAISFFSVYVDCLVNYTIHFSQLLLGRERKWKAILSSIASVSFPLGNSFMIHSLLFLLPLGNPAKTISPKLHLQYLRKSNRAHSGIRGIHFFFFFHVSKVGLKVLHAVCHTCVKDPRSDCIHRLSL